MKFFMDSILMNVFEKFGQTQLYSNGTIIF